MRASATCFLTIAVLAAPLMARAQEEHGHEGGGLGQVGRVHFAVTCAPALQPDFDRAVALLHSFFYEESARRFAEVAARDPRCAMAWWGVAMSQWHPLWEPPDAAALERGWAAIQRADSIGGATERERGYITALASFFRDHERVPHRARALAYRQAMDELRRRFLEDTEATVFGALAIDAVADPADKSYALQRQAAALLEPLYAVAPDHPGLAHYLIHCDDVPPLAERALPMARHYADIAPNVPHALHMPSHIFVRLGLWSDAIRSNLAAAAAGRAYAARAFGGGAYYDQVHAYDYLEYAYLQTTQDRRAREVRDSVAAIRKVNQQSMPFCYALTAVPARYALERRDWAAAAALEPPAGWNLGRYPWTEATTQFARGLGAARCGRLDVARAAVARLAAIHDGLTDPRFVYWAAQVDAQRATVAAWLALAEGRRAEAIEGMRAAAALEDSTVKQPVTPGPVLPARELLGDMLLETRRPAEALAAYEATLRDAPRRFHALAGAMQAARRAGRRPEAARHARLLVEAARDGEGGRPELAEAWRILDDAAGTR